MRMRPSKNRPEESFALRCVRTGPHAYRHTELGLSGTCALERLTSEPRDSSRSSPGFAPYSDLADGTF